MNNLSPEEVKWLLEPLVWIRRENHRVKAWYSERWDLETWAQTRLGLKIFQHVRFYKYQNQDCFEWHRDPNPKTLLIYLTDCQGGETEFGDGTLIKPELGKILIFEGLKHRSHPVEAGTKIILRADVLV